MFAMYILYIEFIHNPEGIIHLFILLRTAFSILLGSLCETKIKRVILIDLYYLIPTFASIVSAALSLPETRYFRLKYNKYNSINIPLLSTGLP